jgi:EAL domain-containing protein (putative c-di-GMP-specific phosphodiesterase class I)
MYLAKKHKRNSYCFYTEEMERKAKEYELIKEELKTALKCNQFALYFQPQYCLRSGRLTGAEALLRWNHPEKGLLTPEKFLLVAERSGLIEEIDSWVIEQACRNRAGWNVPPLSEISLSINISSRQLRQKKDSEHSIAQIIKKHEFNRKLLCLEIKESAFEDVSNKYRETLCELKNLGLTFCIDDFGSGNLSLAKIRNTHSDILTIDKVLLHNAIRNLSEDDKAVITACIELAHCWGLRVVAKGVETEEHLEFLRSINCDVAQGFLLARPMPLQTFIKQAMATVDHG